MPQREQDDLPYRSPVSQAVNSNPVTKDEDEHSTLKSVFKILEETTTGLYKDFDAFQLYKDKLPADRAKMLLHDVEVKQAVYEIVAPLVQRVGDAIAAADSNFRRRQSK